MNIYRTNSKTKMCDDRRMDIIEKRRTKKPANGSAGIVSGLLLLVFSSWEKEKVSLFSAVFSVFVFVISSFLSVFCQKGQHK